MPRNFYRRVEVMFPIEQADLRDRILREIVPAHLMDNVKARILQPDGCYIRQPIEGGETLFRAQERLLALRPGVTAAASDMRLAAASASGGPVATSSAEEAAVEAEAADDLSVNGNGAVRHDLPLRAAGDSR